MVPSVILIGADKGGVGKTMLTRALLDYLAVRSVAVRSFDTQFGGNLVRFAPAAAVIDIDSVQDQMLVFDGVSERVLTVVDICAGLLSPTLGALDEAHLLDDVRAARLRLVLLHVLGPTVASIDEVSSAAHALGGAAKHLLVKNHINDTQFFDWDKGPARALFEQMTDVTVNVPQLAPIACETLEKRGGSFLSFVDDARESRLLRGRIRTWLDCVWAEFDRVNILGPADEQAVG
jgi:hypothetical protein